MECIEARALKSRFQSQVAVKTTSQVFCNDDFWCLTGINSAASDDFSVEELLNLDFSDKELQDGCLLQEDEVPQKGCSNVHSSSSSSSFSGADEFDSLGAGELTIPVDDLADLEWLSQFVDDSTSGLSLLWPVGGFTAANSVEAVTRPPQKAKAPSFPSTVPSKPRSKRSRPMGRPWSLESPPLSNTDSSSASSASSYGSSTTVAPFVFENPVHDTELFSSVVEKPPAKKQKRKSEPESGSMPGRRCTHCQVQKTPQWRTGPLGPKTLCNACGVRFKSGRLFPEYRPACSPTFSQEVHSNSHRKVLEMRRKKEMTAVEEPGSVRAVQTQSL